LTLECLVSNPCLLYLWIFQKIWLILLEGLWNCVDHWKVSSLSVHVSTVYHACSRIGNALALAMRLWSLPDVSRHKLTTHDVCDSTSCGNPGRVTSEWDVTSRAREWQSCQLMWRGVNHSSGGAVIWDSHRVMFTFCRCY
jgi:hypothetical protein